eukprot:scaffold76389_cov21-Tisochrysis_lutea.AAC.1
MRVAAELRSAGGRRGDGVSPPPRTAARRRPSYSPPLVLAPPLPLAAALPGPAQACRATSLPPFSPPPPPAPPPI